MKKYMITALLITAMISTMTACGGKNNTDTPAEETVVATGELPTANDEKVVIGTLNKDENADVATLPMTDEEKPVVDATLSPDAKSTDAPKTTEDPKATTDPKASTKPVVTESAKPSTQASATATTKPNATTAPKSTTAPKATATTAPAATTAPKTTETPKATQAPAATAKPAANTPAPTAAPVACQHTNYHIENGHDTENVPISGGCYEVYNYSTKVCNDCGYSFGEAKNKVNEVHHGCVITEGVSATCTTDGRTTVWGCDCGGSGTTGGNVIPAFGHDYKEVFDHSEEIPNDDGISVTTKFYYVNVCRNCGDTSAPYEK